MDVKYKLILYQVILLTRKASKKRERTELICLFLTFYYKHYIAGHWHDGYSVRQWPWRPGFNPRSVIPETKTMLLDATLLNTQHYKVRIKGKVSQSWKKSIALPQHLGVVAI